MLIDYLKKAGPDAWKQKSGLHSEFPEKYKTAVIKAADTCTVKKHLLAPPKVEIKVN